MFTIVLLLSGVVLPDGFNIETRSAMPGPVIGRLDEALLVKTGSFGAFGLSRLEDGVFTPIAAGFGVVDGVARSPVTGQLAVGDSSGSGQVWLLTDLDDDGDYLDGGEMALHPVALPLMDDGDVILPFDVEYKPGTDDLYVSGSTLATGAGGVVRIADGAAEVWADGFGFAAGMVWDGDLLYLADSIFPDGGRVWRVEDGAGELFAEGLSGASGLVQADDGSFYVSGLFDGLTFTSGIARILPDGTVEDFASGSFDFTTALTLVEDHGPFTGGVEGGGVLWVDDFGFEEVPKRIDSAPRAGLEIVGEPAAGGSFDMVVSGDEGAKGLWVVSLDQSDTTVAGIGDLCLGFSDFHLAGKPREIGAGGTVTTTFVLHGVQDAVGLPFTVQAFTLQDGDVGIGNAFDLEILP